MRKEQYTVVPLCKMIQLEKKLLICGINLHNWKFVFQTQGMLDNFYYYTQPLQAVTSDLPLDSLFMHLWMKDQWNYTAEFFYYKTRTWGLCKSCCQILYCGKGKDALAKKHNKTTCKFLIRRQKNRGTCIHQNQRRSRNESQNAPI